jgi:hypothetical protein
VFTQFDSGRRKAQSDWGEGFCRQGFGAWEYSWRLPEYDPLDLLYTNMFHCSAVFHRSLWEAVPGGYPTTTLFGYEDWCALP